MKEQLEHEMGAEIKESTVASKDVKTVESSEDIESKLHKRFDALHDRVARINKNYKTPFSMRKIYPDNTEFYHQQSLFIITERNEDGDLIQSCFYEPRPQRDDVKVDVAFRSRGIRLAVNKMTEDRDKDFRNLLIKEKDLDLEDDLGIHDLNDQVDYINGRLDVLEEKLLKLKLDNDGKLPIDPEHLAKMQWDHREQYMNENKDNVKIVEGSWPDETW